MHRHWLRPVARPTLQHQLRQLCQLRQLHQLVAAAVANAMAGEQMQMLLL